MLDHARGLGRFRFTGAKYCDEQCKDDGENGGTADTLT